MLNLVPKNKNSKIEVGAIAPLAPVPSVPISVVN